MYLPQPVWRESHGVSYLPRALAPLLTALSFLVGSIDRSATAESPATIFVIQRSAAEPAPRFDGAVLERIGERMRAFARDQQISGAVTVVTCRGETVQVAAAGMADLENQRPMTEDTLFAIASMTKPVSATAAMILRDEGKLQLDDQVAKYLPKFAETKLKDGARPASLTIRHLMTHTSGLGGSQQNQGTLAETVDTLAARPLDFEPGSRWQYSPGLSVCGRIVEVVSGKPFEVFLQERVFQPLGMVDTTFLPGAAQRARIAVLYGPGDNGSLKPTTHWISDLTPDRSPNPSGGLFSTAADMARFYQLILQEGRWDGRQIVSAESVREMTRVQTDELKTGFTDGNGWGLGWCVIRTPQGVTEMLSPGSFGHGGAFGTQGWLDPQRQMAFVLMIQRTGLPNSDASDMRRELQRLAVEAIR